MEIKTEQKMRFVPATCTKCGAALDVDPSQDAAVCPYCDTAFIVEKAINNYNIEHANIEHVDNVTVDMKGSVDSVLNFAAEQMKESRAERAAWRKRSEETSRTFMVTFMKMFGIISAIMIIAWMIMTIGGFWG